jgi:hypothetical protein
MGGAAACFAPAVGRAAALFASVPAALRPFGMAARDNVLLPMHLWVNSGELTVNPAAGDVAGLGNVIAPPWTTANFNLAVTFDGAAVPPDDFLWLPGEFERRAQLKSGVEIRTLLSPVFDQRGLVEWIELRNPSPGVQRVAVAIASRGQFDRVSDEHWTFGAVTRWQGLSALHPQAFRPGWIESSVGDSAWVVGCTLPHVQCKEGAFHGAVDLAPGQTASFALVLAVGPPGDARALAEKVAADPAGTIAADRSGWVKSIEALYARLPRVTSSNRALVDFYDRAILSYPLARWDAPELAAHPWYATCGMDGGALCAYLWDYSYCARLNALAFPESDRDLIRLFLRTDLATGYALLPFSGKIMGAHYSYNDYAIVRLIYHYVLLTGDTAFLRESINGRTVWEWAYARSIYRDDLAKPVELIDYGTNYNLLELKRTDNYTHYVPSPNAERCWSYRAVDTLAAWAGRTPPGLSRRADELARVISAQLWSPKDRWFCSLDLNRAPHLGYSIQVFDLLRLDILSPEERDGLLGHLNEREFLSAWGVHSYSKATPEYDVNARVDWGGPGVYAGDAPELVGDLLHAGYFREADDVFSRILWWGQSLPYYPQAIRSDRRDYRRDGRSNLISGATGAELMIFGLLGVQVGIDGTVTINPHLPAFAADLKFSGVEIRGHRFDVSLDRTGYHLQSEPAPPRDFPYGTPSILPPRRD